MGERVLDPCCGSRMFWNETQVKVREVLALTPHQPLFGNMSGKKAGTHWMVFMKPRLELTRAIEAAHGIPTPPAGDSDTP